MKDCVKETMKQLIKPKNKDRRTREYLFHNEIEKLCKTALKLGRHGHRDATMILIGYRHGLRATELTQLKKTQINLEEGQIHVNRLKRGVTSIHPLSGDEIRALRRIFREYSETPYVFVSERKAPLTNSNLRRIIDRAGKKAGIALPVHPHMLRHSTGFKLANDGRDTRSIQHYLGHKSIQHTVRYTEMTANRFKDFWSD
jgi:site-specific recombinase XerD